MLVTPTASSEPSVKRFNVNDKEKRGENVSLDGASSDTNVGSGEAIMADAGVCVCIDRLHYGDHILVKPRECMVQ